MATINELSQAIIAAQSLPCLISSQYVGIAEQSAVFTSPLQGFPTEGNSFAVLSTGIASQAPGVATDFVSTDTGGPILGNEFDILTVSFTFQLPLFPGNLSFDWKFGSEEIPTFTNTHPDGFQAFVITSSGVTNIALLPNNNPVNVPNIVPFANAPGGDSVTPTPPFPTPNDVSYNAVTTNLQTSSIDLSAFAGETVTIIFRVFDVTDASFDSAVFLDNLRIDGCGNPTTLFLCEPREGRLRSCFCEKLSNAVIGTRLPNVYLKNGIQFANSTLSCFDRCTGCTTFFVGNQDFVIVSCEDIAAIRF